MVRVNGNPCLECGACCAFYRVSFYWGEVDVEDAGVPIELTGKLSPHRSFMLGTNTPNPRCIALMGIIGKKVFCSVHSRRPSVCRDFLPSWQEGESQQACDKARAQFNLPPLQSSHWYPHNPTNLPRAA
jgi:Fe-S-cluster containining protein